MSHLNPFVDIYTDLVPTDRVRINSSTPFTPKYVKNNVTRSSDPAQVYASRVQGRQLLLDNPARKSRQKKERKAKKERMSSGKLRSAAGVVGKREAKSKGLWKLATTKFKLFLPLHQLWLDYMSELLSLSNAPSTPAVHVSDSIVPSASGMHAKLVKADLHGAVIAVRQSKNPCLVGLSGIVVHETENAFKIVTKADQQKLIPKAHSIFALAVPLYSTTSSSASAATMTATTQTLDSAQSTTVFDLPHIEFDLYGNQFCFRSADRASRKFKHKETVEL